jgi:zinc protease
MLVGLLTTGIGDVPADELVELVTIEGITEYRLDNGLQVLLYPDSSKPTVTVNLTVFVGSRHEGYGEAGMAHLLEHMVFKGTPDHPEIPKMLQERGARFNGTTSADRTNYFETLPASDENLQFAIRLEADRMVNSLIRGEDLESEMTVVRNEFERGENSPTMVLLQKMAAVAYEWHNYGQSTIGNRSDIERVPLPKLRDFYRRYYQPDNAMLVIAGSFDAEKALEYVRKYFGAIPRPRRELDRTYTEEPPQDGQRTVTLRRVGDTGLVGVAYHVPSGPDPEFAAVQVLSYILATEPAGRLYKALVETQKATSVFGWVRPQHDPGLMYQMAEVRKDDSLEVVRDTLLETIERVGEEGVTQEEVDRVRQQILKQRELQMSDSSQVAVDLSNWASQGDWRLFFLYRDRIEQVTPEQVQAAAAKYLRPNNRTVGMFIPTERADRIAVPPRPDVAAMVRDYEGREAVVEGEQFDPSPENIDARTTRFALPGGLQVALLPKKTRGESVHLRLDLRYGDVENLRGFESACDLLPQWMTRGTAQLTYQQLQDELDKNRTRLNASGGIGRATFSLESKGPQLTAVLGLLRQILREPSLPDAELEVLRREELAQLESAQSDPQFLAGRRLRSVTQPYPNDDVRYAPTIEEEIKRLQTLTPDQVRKLYKGFLNGRSGQLALVGDFDPQEIRPLLESMFADWDAEQAFARIPRQAFTEVPGQTVTINTPDKANAVVYGGMMLAMKDTDDDLPALVLGNFVLGGGALSSRLGDRVRQKEGLSYGIFSGFSADALDPAARWTIAAIANPQNVPKVQTAIREEIDRLLADGIPAEELTQAKSGYLQRQTVSRTNDSQLVSQLTESLEAGRTMAYHADLEARIAELSDDQIVRALRKHLVPERLIVVLAGDFEKDSQDKTD